MILAMIMAASSNVTTVVAAAELTAILVVLDSLLLSVFTALLTAIREEEIGNVFSEWFK